MANDKKHPMSPRQKRLQLSMWASLFAGLAIGILINAFENTASTMSDADVALAQLGGPINPIAAIVLVVTMIMTLFPLAIIWHKNADEHDERAILWGSTIGVYVTLALGIAWALLFKGSLLPKPNVVGLMGILCLSSLVPYLWLKYR